MNLHGLVVGAISVVNPQISINIQVSQGYQTNADGSRTPKYAPAVIGVPAQMQALSSLKDITQLEGLNLQGTVSTIYINSYVDGLVRVDNEGGDLITTPDGNVWLVAKILERWPDWCKAAMTLQNGT